MDHRVRLDITQSAHLTQAPVQSIQLPLRLHNTSVSTIYKDRPNYLETPHDRRRPTMPLLQPRPGHLLLLFPLCTSSATLGLALSRHPISGARSKSRPSPPADETTLAGLPLLTLAQLTTGVAGVLAARWLRAHETLETSAVGEWYLLGAAVAGLGGVGLPGMRRMVEGPREEGGKGAEDGRGLWWAVGGVVVNGLAVVCFAEGVGLSMWVI